MRPPLSTRSVILDAAALADEIGFDALSLSAVARRLGVKTPSLYSHVRDLAALRDGVTSVALRRLGDEVAVASAGLSRGDAVRGFARANRDFAAESPGLWQSLQRRAGAGAVDSDAARRIAQLTEAVLQGYGLSGVDRVHAIRLMSATITGFIALEGIGSFGHRDPAPDESWTVAMDALDAALAAWPHTAHLEDPAS